MLIIYGFQNCLRLRNLWDGHINESYEKKIFPLVIYISTPKIFNSQGAVDPFTEKLKTTGKRWPNPSPGIYQYFHTLHKACIT